MWSPDPNSNAQMDLFRCHVNEKFAVSLGEKDELIYNWIFNLSYHIHAISCGLLSLWFAYGCTVIFEREFETLWA